MAQRKRSTSRRGLNRNTAWHDFLYGPNSKAVIAAAAIVGALLYLNGAVFQPMYESGPLPVPSRAEVDRLREELTMGLDGVKKGLDETLETAKAANVAAQQANRQSTDFRLTRLLALRSELEAKLKQTPDDKILIQVLASTNIDIANMTSGNQTPQPASLTK